MANMEMTSRRKFQELVREATLPSPPEVAMAIIELAKDDLADFKAILRF